MTSVNSGACLFEASCRISLVIFQRSHAIPTGNRLRQSGRWKTPVMLAGGDQYGSCLTDVTPKCRARRTVRVVVYRYVAARTNPAPIIAIL
jgi:hypothetical protein